MPDWMRSERLNLWSDASREVGCSMPERIHTITLPLPLGLGSVNAYLLRSAGRFVLIDTGPPRARMRVERALGRAGCASSDLRLMVLTHGDYDHTGNACRLRGRYGAPIAIHPLDARMLREGDMFSGRNRPNLLVRWAISKLFGFGRSERCAPDIHLEDAMSLRDYGLDARILLLPGHSSGSVGVLTSEGDLFCGDLLENRGRPSARSRGYATANRRR